MNKLIRQAIVTYARDHKAAGSFVMACLGNNLLEASTRAEIMRRRLEAGEELSRPDDAGGPGDDVDLR